MTSAAVGLVAFSAMQAMLAAIVFKKRWMKYFALGCAVIEVAAVAGMLAVILAR